LVDHLCPRTQDTSLTDPEDEDRDGLRNVGFLTAQPFDPADSPRELDHKKYISFLSHYVLPAFHHYFILYDQAVFRQVSVIFFPQSKKPRFYIDAIQCEHHCFI